MKLHARVFIVVLFIATLSMATPKDSAYTYRFSVENHLGHSYLNFQLDSSWYFVEEHYQNQHFVHNEFHNPSLKEDLAFIQLSPHFSIEDIGKSKIPSKILDMNFKNVVKRYNNADYEQKMGFVHLDIPHKKAVLNLKMLGIGKGFLLVYLLNDQSTWMMWYPHLTESNNGLLKMREVNADKMILESFTPNRKNVPSKENPIFDSTEVEAEFPGGYDKLSAFINSTLEIPDSFFQMATETNGLTSVRVIMCFVIAKDGSVDDFYIDNMSDIHYPSAVNAVINVYRKMPNWIPSTKNGKQNSTYLYLPIKFETF